MIFEFTSYRSYLRAELAERTRRNPSYSLRAMAQHLGFAHSSLSEVINGRANFSLVAARKTAQALKLKATETEYLCLLVQLESMDEPELRASIQERLSKLRPKNKSAIYDLQLDHFKHIADWYHYAILELATLAGFEFTASNIAKKIGISELEAKVAIERLERLELIEIGPNGRAIRHQPNLVVRSDTHHAALKLTYKQMLDQIRTAIDAQSPDERVSGYETVAFDKAALPEVREAFETFFSEIVRISEKHPGKTEVYHLAAHFINLSPERK